MLILTYNSFVIALAVQRLLNKDLYIQDQYTPICLSLCSLASFAPSAPKDASETERPPFIWNGHERERQREKDKGWAGQTVEQY